jgi:hypothetical protein
LPTQPTHKSFAVNKSHGWLFHGMEEVVDERQHQHTDHSEEDLDA